SAAGERMRSERGQASVATWMRRLAGGLAALALGAALLTASGPARADSAAAPSASPPPAPAPHEADAAAKAAEEQSEVENPDAPVAAPVPSALAVQPSRGNVALWLVGIVWGMLVPAAILFTGLSARIRTIAQRIGRWQFFTIAIYLLIFSILTA